MSDPVPVAVPAPPINNSSNGSSTGPSNSASSKRKRSPSTLRSSGGGGGVGGGNQLQINYLARQCADDLPLITKDDTLPNLLDVLGSYSQVLDRQESLASNLGARPLGPILIKRFERCFDAPPKIIASHSHTKGGAATPAYNEDEAAPTVTWLDVVHFAQAHPAQFALATFSEGRRVCQFYYPQKQVRVQVSEEDFLFISSGRCQDLIPPLPIWEDEEKEVGTCEILEKALRELTNAADMVAARTRQLGHRLKGRRMAIQERRTEQGSERDGLGRQSHTPPAANPHPTFTPTNAHAPPPVPPGRHCDPAASIRTDLLKHFQSLMHNQGGTPKSEPRRISLIHPASPPMQPTTTTYQPSLQTAVPAAPADVGPLSSSSVSPVPTVPPNTHPLGPLAYYVENNPAPFRSSLASSSVAASTDTTPKHNFSRPLLPSQESSQPYRSICQVHMESLPKSSRVLPPCDRCRRLRMDCLKNLSSCAGCTKKHARCHWKDVRREEAQALEGFDEVDKGEGYIEFNDAGTTFGDPVDARRPSEDDEMTGTNDQRHDLSIDNVPITLPPLSRKEPERHLQPPIEYAHPAAPFAPQQNQAHEIQQSHQPQEDGAGDGSATFLPNSNPARVEGSENRHAFDLLRLLTGGGDASHADGGSGGGSAVGVRNNGAFRSVYNSHGSEPRPSDGPTATPPNGNAGLVSMAGGDRP